MALGYSSSSGLEKEDGANDGGFLLDDIVLKDRTSDEGNDVSYRIALKPMTYQSYWCVSRTCERYRKINNRENVRRI